MAKNIAFEKQDDQGEEDHELREELHKPEEEEEEKEENEQHVLTLEEQQELIDNVQKQAEKEKASSSQVTGTKEVTKDQPKETLVREQQMSTSSGARTWLKLNLEKRQQMVVQPLSWQDMMFEVEKTKARKKPRTLYATRLNEVGEIIVETATPLADKDDRELQASDYQLSAINLGKQARRGQISSLDLVKARMNKDKQTKDELKAQIEQMRRFRKGLTSPVSEQPS